MNQENEILELAKEGMQLHKPTAPEYIVCAEVVRLNEVNQELVEALDECARYGGGYTNCEESYLPPFVRDKIQTALAKAKGEV